MFSAGALPGPTVGAYSVPRPSSRFNGALLIKGRGKGEREGKGRDKGEMKDGRDSPPFAIPGSAPALHSCGKVAWWRLIAAVHKLDLSYRTYT